MRRRVSLRSAHELAAARMGRIDPVERWLRALWIWLLGVSGDDDAPTNRHHDG